MQYIIYALLLFHTGLGIINSTSLLQQWMSESQKRWGGVGVNTRSSYLCRLRFSMRLFEVGINKVGVKTRKYSNSGAYVENFVHF